MNGIAAEMQYKKYSYVQDFYDDVYELLLKDEAQNLIILGNILIGYMEVDKTGWRDPANWLMATASENGKILLTALMTPPHNLTLYSTDNKMRPEALDCLISGLAQENIPGVISEKNLALAFAEKYSASKQLSYSMQMNQRIYELTDLEQNIKTEGTIRLVNTNDMHFLPYWLEAFKAADIYGRTDMNIPQSSQEAQYLINSNKTYVLEINGIPVSMAGFSRPLVTAIGIALVYTPPYFRRNGYATSLVTQLSQTALYNGYKKCVLYTDLSNPTSNNIYQKIGYKPVCDSHMLKFSE